MNISYYWNELRLEQPMNLIMNWLIALACIICFRKLRGRSSDIYTRWWSRFFLLMGISAFFGGLGHLLSFYSAYPLKTISWCFAAVSIFSAEMGSIELFGSEGSNKRILRVISISKLLLTLVITTLYFSFTIVKWNSAAGFLGIIMPIHVWYFMKTRDNFSLWVVAGVLSMVGPAIVHGFNLSPHPLFDKDDLSHVLMIITFFILYTGIRGKTLGTIVPEIHRAS